MSNITDPERFKDAIARMDAANAEDPNREAVEGVEVPKELLYSRRMTEWLERFDPEASEVLQLAVRAQHIRRWVIPRRDYPMDRAGYKKWRTDLGRFHATTAAEFLERAGYDEETIERVGKLLRKEKLKLDPEVQCLEDVACLVFLDAYADDFAQSHDDEKMIRILRKTWVKMSDKGHAAALTIPLSERLAALVTKALA